MTLGSGRYWINPREKDDAMTGIRVTLPRGTKTDGGKVKPPAPKMAAGQRKKIEGKAARAVKQWSAKSKGGNP